jgi:hypothetical protein
MTHRCTLHVEVAGPAELAAVVEAVERLGHRVECPVLDEWSRLRARDELLQEAHALMSGTPWRRSVQLAEQIGKFEGILWPRLRDRETPPEPCSRLRSLLFGARRCGPLPGTARQLHNIATKRNAPCDFREKPLSSAPDLERGI